MGVLAEKYIRWPAGLFRPDVLVIKRVLQQQS